MVAWHYSLCLDVPPKVYAAISGAKKWLNLEYVIESQFSAGFKGAEMKAG